MLIRFSNLAFPAVLAFALGASTTALSQEPPSTALDAQIAALEASGESPNALTILRETAEIRAKTSTLATAAERFQERVAELPGRLDTVQQSLSAPPPAAPSSPDLANRPLQELEADLEKAKTSLDQARTNQSRLEAELQNHNLRSTALPATNSKLASSLSELEAALPGSPPANASPEELASHARQLAQQALLRQSIAANEQEIAFIKAAAELAEAELSLTARDITRLTADLASLQNVVDSKRRNEAEMQAAKARSDADLSTDINAITELAERNAELAASRAGDDGVTAKLRKANSALNDVASELKLITDYYQNAKRRVDLVSEAGFSLGESTGELLRSERRALPDLAELRTDTRNGIHDNTAAGLDLIKLEQERRDLLIRFEEMVAHTISIIPPGADAQRAEAEKEARRLLDARRELLDLLVKDYRTLSATLSETNLKRQSLIAITRAYARLIDERVLWFRSAPVINTTAIVEGAHTISTLVSPERWTLFFQAIARDFASNTALWIAAILAVVLLVSRRPAHKRNLAAASEMAARSNCRTYLPTAKALTYTALLSLPSPLALAFVALRHGGIDNGGIAAGLYEIACQLLVFGFLRRACYKQGLAVDHFRLLPVHARTLHVTLTTFLWFAVPVAFALGVLDSPEGHPGARLLFITAMLVFVGFIGQLLKPSRNLIASASFRAGTILLGIVSPLVLAAGAAAGYFYTVRELQWRLEASLSLVLVLLLVSALIRRWFLVARRRLAIEQAKRKRRSTAEIGSAQESAPVSQEELESATIDITKIKDQTSQLLRSGMTVALAVGLWGIWSQVLPALTILDDVHLWRDTTEVDSTAPSQQKPQPEQPTSPFSLTPPPDGASTQAETATATPTTNPAPDFKLIESTLAEAPKDPNFGWVTLADLALSLLTFILTYIAARNIPGLLDIAVLHRLDLKPGGSFAVTASARYLIVLVGVILAFSQIGITWSKVQWIAAAVTVGIGFGLQEVFANFVAGLILLFERPIRLGDFVTVGTVSGQVTRIEIRATTIRDFSNKELIVPNKEFITGQLVNWTLTDPVIRIEIPVGIAYGSDTELARKLLLEVAAAHPFTTTDPAPQALFLNFGASSLDFQLRVHIASVAHLVPVQNDLHFAIDKAFRENGIEIAFPQTDIHIRSMPAPPEQNTV